MLLVQWTGGPTPQAQPVIVILGGIILASSFPAAKQMLQGAGSHRQRKTPRQTRPPVSPASKSCCTPKRCFRAARCCSIGIAMGLVAWGAEGVPLLNHARARSDMTCQTALFIYVFFHAGRAISFLPGGLGGNRGNDGGPADPEQHRSTAGGGSDGADPSGQHCGCGSAGVLALSMPERQKHIDYFG